MSIELTFTTRETYIAWRSNWRSAYAEQTQEIREIKKSLVALRGNETKTPGLQSELHYARRLANRMMLTLAEGKVMAQCQYQAQRAREEKSQAA